MRGGLAGPPCGDDVDGASGAGSGWGSACPPDGGGGDGGGNVGGAGGAKTSGGSAGPPCGGDSGERFTTVAVAVSSWWFADPPILRSATVMAAWISIRIVRTLGVAVDGRRRARRSSGSNWSCCKT